MHAMFTRTLVLFVCSVGALVPSDAQADSLTHSVSSFVPILAATSIESGIDSFLNFMQKLMILPALALVLYAGYLISTEGRIREAIMSLCGALLLALAVPIVRAIFSF